MKSLKPLHVAALIVTFLLVATVVNSRLQSPRSESARSDAKKKKKTAPTQVAERCVIKRAVFGGAESAVLKVKKDQFVHYVVLDLPGGDPKMPEYQSRWLDTNYGEAEPLLIGVYPTVEAGVRKAASLCKRN